MVCKAKDPSVNEAITARKAKDLSESSTFAGLFGNLCRHCFLLFLGELHVLTTTTGLVPLLKLLTTDIRSRSATLAHNCQMPRTGCSLFFNIDFP